MAGLFDGLEIGKRALATHQLWLNIIGHNIANVNTPGYTRQRVDISTTYPMDHPVGLIGTGVTATDVHHIRDLFLNQQFRAENRSLGRWSSAEKAISQVEALFAEPNSDALGDLIDKFWNSWTELGNNPESMAARTSLKEQTNLLCSSLNRLYRHIDNLRSSVNNEISLAVDKINTLTAEIASLNMQIGRAELGSARANDLRDQRDLLIDEMSQYVDVNSREDNNGMTTVYIGAMVVVDGSSSYALDTVQDKNGEKSVDEVIWKGTTRKIKILDGQIKGLIDVRDQEIPGYLAALDELAKSLVENVNAVHRSGYGLDGTTGLDFFDPDRVSAADIRINAEIDRVPARLAASQSGEVGDNRNALAIADLRNVKVLMGGTATIGEFYNSVIGLIGIDAAKAKTHKNNYQLLVAQLANARESVQGVSLDEEMTQMIKFQHAYDAAARVITTMDQSLETVIKGMGIVGR